MGGDPLVEHYGRDESGNEQYEIGIILARLLRNIASIPQSFLGQVFFPVTVSICYVALAWKAATSLREAAFLAEICHGVIVAVLGFREIDWRSAE